MTYFISYIVFKYLFRGPNRPLWRVVMVQQGRPFQDMSTARALRRSFVGGSDARIIMGQHETALLRLWREKRGEIEPEDLSSNLVVQLGTVTEDLNRRWYERNTGHAVRDVQRRIQHPLIGWIAATLEGLGEGPRAGVETKVPRPRAI